MVEIIVEIMVEIMVEILVDYVPSKPVTWLV